MERVVALLQTNLKTLDMSNPEKFTRHARNLLVPLGKCVAWKWKPVLPLEITHPEFS